MPLYELNEASPILEKPDSIWVAPTAQLIGAVELKEQSSVWFGAVLRGDNEMIEIGKGSNIQDNAVLHTDPGYPLTVGKGCTIGHQAIVHGCTIANNSLVGMGTTIMNGAEIGENTLIGAGTLIPENKTYPAGVLIIGTPGKVVRELTEEEIETLRKSAQTYRDKISLYQTGLQQIED